MKLLRSVVAAALVSAVVPPAYAQRAATPVPTPAPAIAQPKSVPLPVEEVPVSRRAAADAVNVRLELTITDTYGGTPVKKVVSLLVASGGSGRIRTNKNVPVQEGTTAAVLNLDALLGAIAGDRIPVEVTFEYLPAPLPPDDKPAGSRPAHVSERLTVVLRDGKPLVVSQSADPATDRKVTVELMASVIK